MKTYQIDGKPEVIEFANLDRIDEYELFLKVMDKLQSHPDVTVGSKQTGPSEDFYKCTFLGDSFILYYDVDYGVTIYAKEKKVRKKLIELFG